MNCAICLLKTWDMPKSIITGFCARDILKLYLPRTNQWSSWRA